MLAFYALPTLPEQQANDPISYAKHRLTDQPFTYRGLVFFLLFNGAFGFASFGGFGSRIALVGFSLLGRLGSRLVVNDQLRA